MKLHSEISFNIKTLLKIIPTSVRLWLLWLQLLLNRFFCYKALNGERKSRPQDSPTTAAWFFLAQCHILTKRLPILDVCLFSFTKDHLFRALPTFIIPSTELKPSALFENIDLFLLSTSKPLRLNHISTHFPQLNFITKWGTAKLYWMRTCSNISYNIFMIY